MPVTPERHPGPMIEDDELILKDNPAGDPTEEGAVRKVGGSFRMRDALGVFNPRTGGTGLTEEEHKILRQLIHFIDDGPAEGFTSGAYRETTGTVFPTAIVWWESSAKLKKIVEKLTTWSGPFPTTIVWKVYATDGVTVLATVTDTITWSGPFESSRTRTIA